jgi:hypothetical protein
MLIYAGGNDGSGDKSAANGVVRKELQRLQTPAGRGARVWCWMVSASVTHAADFMSITNYNAWRQVPLLTATKGPLTWVPKRSGPLPVGHTTTCWSLANLVDAAEVLKGVPLHLNVSNTMTYVELASASGASKGAKPCVRGQRIFREPTFDSPAVFVAVNSSFTL